jgi:hypothetical protein
MNMNNLALSNDAAEIRRNYHAEYRKRNREKIRKYNAQYWERKALEKKLQNKSIGRNKHEE